MGNHPLLYISGTLGELAATSVCRFWRVPDCSSGDGHVGKVVMLI